MQIRYRGLARPKKYRIKNGNTIPVSLSIAVSFVT